MGIEFPRGAGYHCDCTIAEVRVKVVDFGGDVMNARAINLAIFFTALSLASGARADGGPAADACAAKLPPDGKAIYAATVANHPTADTLKSVVESQTRSLAMAGKIGRGEAREHAVSAAECVRLGF
jgi:hypothetical protein